MQSIAFLRVEPDNVFLDGNVFPGHESPPSLPRDRDSEIPVMFNDGGDQHAAIQYWLCHLPRSDAAGFHGSVTGALAASSIGHLHCGEIGRARSERLRA